MINSDLTKKMFLSKRTAPLVQVPHDDFETVKGDKWFGVKGL